MARVTTTDANLVVVVGQPGLKGLHGLLRTTRDLLAYGIDGHRLLPVVNRSPRSPRARAEITAAFGKLLGSQADLGVPSPIHLREQRHLDGLLLYAAANRLPEGWVNPVARSVSALLDQTDDDQPMPPSTDHPPPVRPGSLGSWTEEDSDRDGEAPTERRG